MKDEYNILKEEILVELSTIQNCKNLVYTLVIALLAFSFEKNNAWMFLLPFVAIIPLYNLIIEKIDSTLRTGTYMLVFLEPYLDIKWETNLYKYDKKYKNDFSTKKINIDSFVILSVVCIVLSIINLNFKQIQKPEVWGCIIFQFVLVIYCIWIFFTRRIDYTLRKEKYIKEWEQIKNPHED